MRERQVWFPVGVEVSGYHRGRRSDSRRVCRCKRSGSTAYEYAKARRGIVRRHDVGIPIGVYIGNDHRLTSESGVDVGRIPKRPRSGSQEHTHISRRQIRRNQIQLPIFV